MHARAARNDHLALGVVRLEEAVQLPVGYVVAELHSLLDRVAEVEAEPDPCVDDLVLDVVHGVELLAGREDVASVLSSRHVDVDVLCVQRRRERVAEGCREAAKYRFFNLIAEVRNGVLLSYSNPKPNGE